ncbi:MAG TPA: class I SAM-dependent methyltransferase [Bryobacteraceae bacterium]|nr:class I SAM-dependent methyltransferase [Bryobacteraceae bacterium]
MGEGNRWHRQLVAPATERLLAIRAGERALELACGNGQFARRLAELGAHVVACDFSSAQLECARRRTVANADRIEYRLADLTKEEDLAGLGAGEFDAAVCNMALMDIAAITPLLHAVRGALKAGGRFVFSVPHPCFNTSGTTMLAGRDDYEGEGTLTLSIRVRRYRTLGPQKAIGIAGQPLTHYYFHRPLGTLLPACFRAGFVLDGLEEPALERGPETAHALRWGNFSEIPPVLVARLRASPGGAGA